MNRQRSCPHYLNRAVHRLFRTAFIALALTLALSALLVAPSTAHADAGTVYSCAVHPLYQHPVSGEIEDSGGASARATGQAMVDSCVSGSGMMEVTEAGDCYLTIRMSLVDLTSGHTFYVQDWGDSGWSTPAMGVTGTGSDANGTTNDVCIQLPSANGIVRVSMFVESMGRDVIFYVYADGLSEPAPGDFTATIVTEAASGEAPAPVQEASEEAPTAQAVEQQPSETQASTAAPASTAPSANGTSPASGASGAGEAQGTAAGAAAGAAGQSGSAAVTSADGLVEGAGAATAQGLSLSTAPADVAEAEGNAGAVSPSSGEALFSVWLAVVSAGVVLMLVAAFIVFFCRRNWNRWAGYDPDDYSKEYRRG